MLVVHLQKIKERTEKFMKTGDADFIYKNELDKACFQHDMAYGKSYDGYQRGLASMVYKFFDKKSSGGGIMNVLNYQLANELHKPIIRKF